MENAQFDQSGKWATFHFSLLRARRPSPPRRPSARGLLRFTRKKTTAGAIRFRLGVRLDGIRFCRLRSFGRSQTVRFCETGRGHRPFMATLHSPPPEIAKTCQDGKTVWDLLSSPLVSHFSPKGRHSGERSTFLRSRSNRAASHHARTGPIVLSFASPRDVSAKPRGRHSVL